MNKQIKILLHYCTRLQTPKNIWKIISVDRDSFACVCRLVTMVIQFSVLILLHCCLVLVTTAEDYKCLPLLLRQGCCWINETYAARNVIVFLSILINFLAAMINIVSPALLMSALMPALMPALTSPLTSWLMSPLMLQLKSRNHLWLWYRLVTAWLASNNNNKIIHNPTRYLFEGSGLVNPTVLFTNLLWLLSPLGAAFRLVIWFWPVTV